MATKRPLCMYSGTPEELRAVDTIEGMATTGLFELDIDGGLMPVTDIQADAYYELDVNNDIQPIAAV